MGIFMDISAFLLVFLVLAPLVCSLSFDLPNIGPKDIDIHINISGDASITTQGIQLATNERELARNFKAGRATYIDPLHLWDKATGDLVDFTTNFTFNIDSEGNTSFADGLAFFLANFFTPFDTIATGGGGLGLMDRSLDISPDPFVAVVFDTFSNQKSITLTTVTINVKTWNRSVAQTEWQNDVTQGKDNNASITYSAGSKLLRVDFTQFSDGRYSANSLIWQIDLRDVLPEFVSIGFSGATGRLSEKNTVRSWQFDSTPPRPTSQNPKNKKGLVIGLSAAGVVILLALSIFYICFIKKNRRAAKGDNQITLGRGVEMDMEDTRGKAMDSEFEKAGPKKFSYSELENATNNFSKELGEGGFGSVYKGMIGDMEVAVKKVSKDSKQGIQEYASEVKIISRLRHRNLVQLHGWCHEKEELLLVYEYMPRGSLDSHLFFKENSSSALYWSCRYKIAQGLASALSYLHEEWEQCVLHRDIKSSNVLLDSKFNAKLGDFGLASLVDHENAPEKTISGGTPGYIAPECFRTGKTSKESDVYSFGIVALEIGCGQKTILANEAEGVKMLVEWVWDLYGNGKLLEAADPKLCGNFEKQEMERLMVMGLWCAHPASESRPEMSQVVNCLKHKSQSQLPNLPLNMPKPAVSSSHLQTFTRSSQNTVIASTSSPSALLPHTF